MNKISKATVQKKSFNNLVHKAVREKFNLSRRDNLVFYKLLGFLLRNDKSFPYTNEKLSHETLYKLTSIKAAIKNLEKLGLIKKEGITFRRRFYKGDELIKIITHGRNSSNEEQNNNCTYGRSPTVLGQKSTVLGQSLTKIEHEENVLKHKEEEIFSSPIKPHMQNEKIINEPNASDKLSYYFYKNKNKKIPDYLKYVEDYLNDCNSNQKE